MNTKLPILLIFTFFSLLCFGQKKGEINWLNFEQLEDSLQAKPKKTFIYFYADWCVYCKKMERNAFRNPAVTEKLHSNYYAVKMNAESTDTIHFDGQKFYNLQAETQRNGIHAIPLLLASRKNREFSLPAILVLDENFKVKDRKFEYLTSEKLKKLMSEKD
ncbi:thioredoxin family protein [Zunongwangia sp. F363]|uniref:Thioredoxin family protein n=1 Tax=Autumnicola tepida TaxID=3075595 RepID=A0ABU3C7N0_9FLAO|nr:thioredoxin fold domain-containing protein [Zunongwangia sp. F363]MDT0642085.1 thioredoxin family protein [Zunongwangia sp. F363]